MSLVGTDHSNMRKYLGEHGAGLRWPFQSESRVHASLPSLLQKIIDWEEDNGKKYSVSDGMEYVILLRNLYKHYDELPEEIKVIGVSVVLDL